MGTSACFPSRPPFNPLRLASNYRDYWGCADSKFTEWTDQLMGQGCYIPRIFHAPSTQEENAGVAANDYLEYSLPLPAGSFLIGFLHHFTGLQNANDAANPPVRSSFRLQITDIRKEYRFFEKPVPEAYLLNDAPSTNSLAQIDSTALYELNPQVKLLPAPFPVTPPGIFKIEFWNLLASLNTGIRLSLLVAVPDELLKLG